MVLRFVTATRVTLDEFKRHSPLFQSLFRVSGATKIHLDVEAENRRPLPEIYNRAIDSACADDVLVFIHDDVYVDDWLIAERLNEALATFDVVGVAGNRRRMPKQEAWCLKGMTRKHDLEYLSGAISHGHASEASCSVYGLAPAEVRLLDGVFLAARSKTLQETGVRFDAAFPFHFYDTDFCRSCELAGLRMGTWPIAISHLSAGRGWATAEWDALFTTYLQKWKN